ncbi:MAG: hypothetical protein WCI18_09995 [Pseudomonadota bacterium]
MVKILGLFLAVISSLAWGEKITFKRGGKEVKSLDTTELAQHAVPTKVFEHLSETEVTYQAVPFRELLESVYGAHWGEAGEELLFTCVDGYQPSLPLSIFKSNKSFLALSKPGEDFKATTTKDKKSISLGPTYLIWENLKNLEIREKAGSIWPYQVIAVDLIKFKDHFGKMAPHEKASPLASEGFLIFREKCMSCHKMNGEGAPTGIDLNRPVPKIQMYSPKSFEKWIMEPKTLRPETSMPGLMATDPKAAKHIKPLLKYLESMAETTK